VSLQSGKSLVDGWNFVSSIVYAPEEAGSAPPKASNPKTKIAVPRRLMSGIRPSSFCRKLARKRSSTILRDADSNSGQISKGCGSGRPETKTAEPSARKYPGAR